MTFAVPFTCYVHDRQDADYIAQYVKDALTGDGRSVDVGLIQQISEALTPTVIHTDGGCDAAKDGLGAWAYTVHHPDGTYQEFSGTLIGSTNNRMEMFAVLKALETHVMGRPLLVISDSEYVIRGTTSWARNWVRNGWRNAKGEPVANKDLWLKLLALYQLHDVKFNHVKGHAGNTFNERCDVLCTSAMMAASKAITLGEKIDMDEGGPSYCKAYAG